MVDSVHAGVWMATDWLCIALLLFVVVVVVVVGSCCGSFHLFCFRIIVVCRRKESKAFSKFNFGVELGRGRAFHTIRVRIDFEFLPPIGGSIESFAIGVWNEKKQMECSVFGVESRVD